MSPYTNLAILHSGNNQQIQVKNILLRGLAHFPENAEIYYFMGLNEGSLGNNEGQLKYLKEAYKLQPENPKYSYNYILTEYNFGNKMVAQKELSKALEYNAENEGLLELKAYFKR